MVRPQTVAGDWLSVRRLLRKQKSTVNWCLTDSWSFTWTFQDNRVHPHITATKLQKGTVKCTLVQALRLCTVRTAHGHGTRRGWGVRGTPLPLFTPGKDPVPMYRRLGGPQSRSGQVRKISPLPGFDLRTVQPVASRYTDYATRPTQNYKATYKKPLISLPPQKFA